MNLPRHLLYATSARIGGSGLDSVAYESLLGAHEAGSLGRAIAYDNRQEQIPQSRIRSLRWHPVRLLSWIDRPHYYGAKKHYMDALAAGELATGRYDLFHGWASESVRALRVAKEKGIPSVIDVPTWHRNKGKQKPTQTKKEREAAKLTGWKAAWNSLLVSRQQQLEEYELADLILVLSQKAEETFLAAGIAPEKLFRHTRGVDTGRFSPGTPPPIFRAVFVGALIERKGVHHLLQVWHALGLKNAELVLVGSVHEEIRPYLRDYADSSVKVAGFVPRVEDCYRSATVHIFPSTCEGSAKATYEAAACGLPQITTRESGDVVTDGVHGLVIPCDDPNALASAIEKLYHDPDLCARMGAAARKRAVEELTWDHFRQRLLTAYRQVYSKRQPAIA